MPFDRQAYMREYNRRPEQREAARRYRSKPETMERLRLAKQRQNSTEAGKAAQRSRQLRLKYGITQKDYNDMLEVQNFTCAVCTHTHWEKALVVDHSHETGRVRGLLCDGCNLALGKMNDSPEQLRAAAAYLESFK